MSSLAKGLPPRGLIHVFVAVLLCLVLASCGYNTIPTLEEQAKAKWADVQNNYQRRADLIPNLVATVQGYAKQEKDVLTAVVEARANLMAASVSHRQVTEMVASNAALASTGVPHRRSANLI